MNAWHRRARPQTGGRKLEELAFEIASTESMVRAARKAQKLATRGVRRIFAIDIERQCVSEWSNDGGAWSTLDQNRSIEDPVFAAPLPVAALFTIHAAEEAIVRALLAKENPVFVAAVEAQRAAARREREADARRQAEEIERRRNEAIGHGEGEARGMAKALFTVLDMRKIELTAEQGARILEKRDLAQLTSSLTIARTRADAAEFFKNS